MSRVTSKLQVTIPKAIADDYGIAPGDEIEFLAAGEIIRVKPPETTPRPIDRTSRLRRFDQATERQRARQAEQPRLSAGDRGWRRDDLYERGSAR